MHSSGSLCVFGCGSPSVSLAYGQPVCGRHLAICLEISEAERREWATKCGNGGKTLGVANSCQEINEAVTARAVPFYATDSLGSPLASARKADKLAIR